MHRCTASRQPRSSTPTWATDLQAGYMQLASSPIWDRDRPLPRPRLIPGRGVKLSVCLDDVVHGQPPHDLQVHALAPDLAGVVAFPSDAVACRPGARGRPQDGW